MPLLLLLITTIWGLGCGLTPLFGLILAGFEKLDIDIEYAEWFLQDIEIFTGVAVLVVFLILFLFIGFQTWLNLFLVYVIWCFVARQIW